LAAKPVRLVVATQSALMAKTELGSRLEIAIEPAVIPARYPSERSQKDQEGLMHSKIGTAIVALVLFDALSAVSFAQSNTSGAANPKAEGIGSTSSTHNPRPSSPGPTGMEKGKATGSEMGTDTSTHNPSEKR
jgi:hypothetical protein